MSIIVSCPGCLKSFKVSDKFAGKSGPCPNCKRVIQVPDKSQEVTVHAPEEFAGGGRSTSGKLVVKPEAFVPITLQPVATTLIVAAVLIALLLAFVGGHAKLFQNSLVATVVGLLAVSPPLVVAAYAVLRNHELEPYRGRELYIRSTLCGLGYAFLWGIFTVLASRGVITGDIWIWLFVVPPLLAVGGMFSFAAFDLPYGDAVFHCAFYIIATLVLRWAAGLKWVWDVQNIIK
jgi:hypothetical protein